MVAPAHWSSTVSSRITSRSCAAIDLNVLEQLADVLAVAPGSRTPPTARGRGQNLYSLMVTRLVGSPPGSWLELQPVTMPGDRASAMKRPKRQDKRPPELRIIQGTSSVAADRG